MRNNMKGEFIGQRARIIECTDPSLAGVEGIIIDETRNTFLIDANGKEKMVAKDIAKFEINGDVIDGKRIKYRPEDRIKKVK